MDFNYEQAVEYIHGIGMFGSKPGLERISAILKHLDNPEKDLKIIHVAGTNGKGSTSAMLASILLENGFDVGLFISPYLESFNERIQVNGKPIKQEELAKLVSEIKPIVEKVAETEAGQPTQFEIVTAMGFKYFKNIGVDFVVLEVGLGGTYDATNIVNPIISLITSIGLDHQAILGDTLEEIAAEKAGIIKKNKPIVIAVTKKGPLKVIREKAKQKKASFYALGESFNVKRIDYSIEGQTFEYTIDQKTNVYKTSFLGEHQIRNASLALTTAFLMKDMGYNIDNEKILSGLAKAKWPGRLEIINKNPYIILDGAHNEQATEVISSSIKELFSKRIILVLGILSDKNYQKMVKDLVPLAKTVFITAPDYYRALDTTNLTKESKKYCEEVFEIDGVANAIDEAINISTKDDLILITGSLYTVGEARTHLKQLYK
ncbi:MAG: bifunctional folylpolyglutamate synthase/dihydrofolate synthase [Clostridia bacterium]